MSWERKPKVQGLNKYGDLTPNFTSHHSKGTLQSIAGISSQQESSQAELASQE